jgi:hypothetical protein
VADDSHYPILTAAVDPQDSDSALGEWWLVVRLLCGKCGRMWTQCGGTTRNGRPFR